MRGTDVCPFAGHMHTSTSTSKCRCWVCPQHPCSASGLCIFLQAAAGYVLHIGNLEGTLRVGEKVHAAIDHERRDKIMANHTSTHVLNHALRELLGEHINQSGSAVDEDRLRFDFTHPKKLEPQEVSHLCMSSYAPNMNRERHKSSVPEV